MGRSWKYHDASPHTIPRPHLTKMPVLFIVYYQEAAFSSEIWMLFVSISLRFLSSPLWTAHQHKELRRIAKGIYPLSFGRLKDLVQRNVWPKNTIYRLRFFMQSSSRISISLCLKTFWNPLSKPIQELHKLWFPRVPRYPCVLSNFCPL